MGVDGGDRPPPGYAGPIPYGFGVVELGSCIRVVTRLTVPDPAPSMPGRPCDWCSTMSAAAARSGPVLGVRPGVLVTDVGVAGVGIHPFGRFADKTVTDLGAEAVRARVHRSRGRRLRPGRRVRGTAYGGVASGHKVLGRLSTTGMPIIDVEAGCASGAAALMLAASSIRSGQYETVLAFGIERMPKGIIRSSFFEPWQEEAGLTSTPAYFALRAQRLMVNSGVTDETWPRWW